MAKKGKIDFELNLPGLNELMTSAEMNSALSEAANAVARNAENLSGLSDGYAVEDAHSLRWIGITSVRTVGRESAKDSNDHNTLVKATLQAGLRFKEGK